MNYTLITGASRGIGEALARRCAQEGHHLILVARSQEKLEALAQELSQLYHIDTQVVALDLLLPQAAEQLKQICQDRQWSVRVLINNAGFGLWGTHAEVALADQMDVVQLNVVALVALCHTFIPLLRQPDAHILNVGSISSYQSVPYFSIYAASKSFVLSFSRSLRLEVQPLGIGVTCVCPGFTQSHFFDKAGTAPIISSARFQMTTNAVADAAIRGMNKNQAVVVPGFIFKICTYASRYLPVRLTTRLLRRLLKPTGKAAI